MPAVFDRVLSNHLYSRLTRSNCSNTRHHQEREEDSLARFDCTGWQNLQSQSSLGFPSPSKVILRRWPLMES